MPPLLSSSRPAAATTPRQATWLLPASLLFSLLLLGRWVQLPATLPRREPLTQAAAARPPQPVLTATNLAGAR